MLTRLLENAANAADAAQSGSNGADLTQLTNILDCTKDDCIDPDGFIDYILPRLIIIGAAFLLCGAFTALVVFIPAMDTLVCNILEIVFPIAAIAWYSFVSRHAAREYWGV